MKYSLSRPSMLARFVPAVLVLASCASAGDSNDEVRSDDGSEVTVVEVLFDVDSTDEAWNLVGIGDSFIGWRTVAEQ
jgi:hypothetical protein